MGKKLEQSEFVEKIIQINRVAKKTKGGNRIGFSVVVVVGDKKGRVGVGLGKAPDVKKSIQKGASYAKKHLVVVPLVKGTIPHDIYLKFGAAKLILKRAPEGTGVIAGGAVRSVVEAAGVTNIVSKVLGTSNKASNVYACLEALKSLKSVTVKEEILVENKSQAEIKEMEKSIEEKTDKPAGKAKKLSRKSKKSAVKN